MQYSAATLEKVREFRTTETRIAALNTLRSQYEFGVEDLCIKKFDGAKVDKELSTIEAQLADASKQLKTGGKKLEIQKAELRDLITADFDQLARLKHAEANALAKERAAWVEELVTHLIAAQVIFTRLGQKSSGFPTAQVFQRNAMLLDLCENIESAKAFGSKIRISESPNFIPVLEKELGGLNEKTLNLNYAIKISRLTEEAAALRDPATIDEALKGMTA